jgi:hypothetical protein
MPCSKLNLSHSTGVRRSRLRILESCHHTRCLERRQAFCRLPEACAGLAEAVHSPTIVSDPQVHFWECSFGDFLVHQCGQEGLSDLSPESPFESSTYDSNELHVNRAGTLGQSQYCTTPKRSAYGNWINTPVIEKAVIFT